MLRSQFGGMIANLQLRCASTTAGVWATTSNRCQLQRAAPQLEKIFMFIGDTTSYELCRPGSQSLVSLGRLIDSLQGGHDMRKVRNKIHRKYGSSSQVILSSLKRVVENPFLLEMSMYRKIGPKQISSFTRALRQIIDRADLSQTEKKERLYNIIAFQHDLFIKISESSGFCLPYDIHKWFWENIPKTDSFNHFYFLIKNDIHLSSCHYVWSFARRLMQGSEMEFQLATFQIFLHEKSHRSTFHAKFSKLYSFDAMNVLVNKILSSKDFRFIETYLAALLVKMEQPTMYGNLLSTKKKQSLFVQFSDTLLYYLSQTGNIEMFLQTFSIVLNYMQKVGMVNDSRSASHLLHRPLHFVLKLLRLKGLQEEVFRFITIIQQVQGKKNTEFNKHIITELISSLRSFNDPKLTCQYILSAFQKFRTGELLNELGIWGSVFHQSPRKLSSATLTEEIKSQEKFLPQSMRINDVAGMPVLTELYRVLLSTSARTMGREHFQNFLLELYSNYTVALKQNKFKNWRHDTGILSVFLHNIRLELGNLKLSYEILKDFYSHDFASKVRTTSHACPFSLVVYKNYEISQLEVSHLLSLMHTNKVPLRFRFCTAMVLRYLKLGNPKEAYTWYKKITYAGFDVRHSVLIKAIVDNGWEYPKNFDESLLDKIDNTTTELNDDFLFLQGDGEFDDSGSHKTRDERSLSELIDLVKTVNSACKPYSLD